MSNIIKAEEWARQLKQALPQSRNPEHVQEHIDLLEWLIERVNRTERYERALKEIVNWSYDEEFNSLSYGSLEMVDEAKEALKGAGE